MNGQLINAAMVKAQKKLTLSARLVRSRKKLFSKAGVKQDGRKARKRLIMEATALAGLTAVKSLLFGIVILQWQMLGPKPLLLPGSYQVLPASSNAQNVVEKEKSNRETLTEKSK